MFHVPGIGKYVQVFVADDVRFACVRGSAALKNWVICISTE